MRRIEKKSSNITDAGATSWGITAGGVERNDIIEAAVAAPYGVYFWKKKDGIGDNETAGEAVTAGTRAAWEAEWGGRRRTHCDVTTKHRTTQAAPQQQRSRYAQLEREGQRGGTTS